MTLTERFKEKYVTNRACAEVLGITERSWINWVARFREGTQKPYQELAMLRLLDGNNHGNN